MSELRRDPLTGDWVIIAKERGHRPGGTPAPLPAQDFEVPDPFAEGNEQYTPREVYAVRAQGQRDGPGWQVRAFPNKFPALRIEGSLDNWGDGLYDAHSGIGAHEVVVETPDAQLSMTGMSGEQIVAVLTAWRARVADLSRDKRFSYIQVFKNHGPRSGATQAHSHSQIIALPLLPPALMRMLRNSQNYHADRRRSLQADVIAQERAANRRVIAETPAFIALCPYASQYPFELHITPLHQAAEFAASTDAELSDLAALLRDCFARWTAALGAVDFNIMLLNGPNQGDFAGNWDALGNPAAHYRWHLRMSPRITMAAGFEWATGVYINPVPPEEAAAFMRDANV